MSPLAQRRPVVLAATLVTLSPGCSFIFSQGPLPEASHYQQIDCSGYVPPVLDTIWGGLNAIGALSAWSTSQNEWNKTSHPAPRDAVIGVGLTWLVLSGASAIYGYKIASDCDAVHAGTYGRHRPRSSSTLSSPTVRPLPPPVIPAAPSAPAAPADAAAPLPAAPQRVDPDEP
jgi:hypothetical protein